jgi:TPR repeat protein
MFGSYGRPPVSLARVSCKVRIEADHLVAPKASGLPAKMFVIAMLVLLSRPTLAVEPPITDCDRLVESRMSQRGAKAALQVCTSTLLRYPGNDRLTFNLAQTYVGIGDFASALDLFKKGADQGYGPSKDALGTMYWNGWGVQTNLNEAISWFAKAAESGNAAAEYHLGLRYWNGQGVSQDQAQAVSWYRKSADQGFVRSRVELALAYRSGSGVRQDYSAALHWFQLAAEQGDALAQCYLGEMYYYGTGVDGSYNHALEWFRKSSNQGLKEAKEYIAAIEQQQNPLADQTSRTPAPDRQVRIFAPSNAVAVTGDTVKARGINTILFTEEECQLPLANKNGMYRAWMAYGAHQLGCWYPTIDKQFVFVGEVSSLTHNSGAFWETFPRALLHSDGSATITEPNYNSETFLKNYLGNRMRHAFDNVNEKP